MLDYRGVLTWKVVMVVPASDVRGDCRVVWLPSLPSKRGGIVISAVRPFLRAFVSPEVSPPPPAPGGVFSHSF